MTKSMLGISLIIIGSLLLLSGVYVYTSAKKELASINSDAQLEDLIQLAVADGVLTKKEENKIKELAEGFDLDSEKYLAIARHRIEETEEDSETELIDINKKKGDDFEGYITGKFDKKYFKLKDWAGDKKNGDVYAESTLKPDLKYELRTSKDTVEVWVECKYRSKTNNGEVQVAYPAQLERYKKYQKEEGIPVFIALGIGGKPKNPKELYMLPLDKIDNGKLRISEYEAYKKEVDKDFFYYADQNKWK